MGCPEIEAFVRHWGYIHKQTARALRAVPADRMDYKPKEDMMSLGALTIHIPQAALLFARTALAGTTQKIDLDLSNSTPEEIASAYEANFKQLAGEVWELTREQLDEEVQFFDYKLRRIELLQELVNHEIHHRGQLYTYLHLVDVKPPALH